MSSVWIVHGGAVEPEAARTRDGAIEIAREHAEASGAGYTRVHVHAPNPKDDEVVSLPGPRFNHPGIIHVRQVPIREI